MDVIVVFTIVSSVIVLGFLGSWLFERTKISDILLLMLFGILIGPILDIFGPVDFTAYSSIIGMFALVMILFECGLDLEMDDLMRGAIRSTLLAILSFTLSAVSIATLSLIYLGYDPLLGLLLGSALGGTGAVIVIPLITKMSVKYKTKTIAMLESALVDVLSVVAVITIASTISLRTVSTTDSLHILISQFSIAIVIGMLAGVMWIRILNLLKKRAFSYMLTLAIVLLIFSIVELVEGSGPMAVLTFGAVLGNSHSFFKLSGVRDLVFSDEMRRFQSEVSFLVRAMFLVYIGMILDIASILQIDVIQFAILLVVAIVISRGIAILIALYGDSETHDDRGTLLLMMPRGLTAAVLVLMPVYEPYNIAAANDFLAYAFLVIIFTNVLLTFGTFFSEKRKKSKTVAENETPRTTRVPREDVVAAPPSSDSEAGEPLQAERRMPPTQHRPPDSLQYPPRHRYQQQRPPQQVRQPPRQQQRRVPPASEQPPDAQESERTVTPPIRRRKLR